MTVAEAIAAWLDYRQQLSTRGRIAASTFANQAKIAQLWVDQIGQLDVAAIRKSHIEIAVADMAASRRPITLQGDVQLLSQILNWCEDERIIEIRPRLPTISVPTIEDDLPSDAAFIWVLTNTPTGTAEALEFMLLTGLAPHELERLQDEDYCPERGAVGIGQREDFKIKTLSRRRWVPLNGRARHLWSPPFPSVAALEKAIQRARRPNMPKGAANVTPKMMRKWFSSKLAGDVPEHVLQKLLGHSPGSKITRKHYVRSTPADGEAAVRGLNLQMEKRECRKKTRS